MSKSIEKLLQGSIVGFAIATVIFLYVLHDFESFEASAVFFLLLGLYSWIRKKEYRIQFGIAIGVVLSMIMFSVINLFSLPPYGTEGFPSYAPDKGCVWFRQSFAEMGVSFFKEDCQNHGFPNYDFPIYTETSSSQIVRSSDLTHDVLTMEIFGKNATSTPTIIMNQWYAKLTPQQKNDCSIQNADNSTSSPFAEPPLPTSHKTRLKIDIKPEIVQTIFQENGGLPGGSQYDYLCGSIVGSAFRFPAPYFEFDDRSPTKYLKIDNLPQDNSLGIDLDTISF